MKQADLFFGQIVRKTDLDFLNLGNRQAINETNIDLSNQLGGIINGLEVYGSADGYSIFINAGSFYTGGLFNPSNGLGGGEKGTVYTPQNITSLTPTPVIGGNQSYLLVYAKTVIQNTDPNPNAPNVVYSAKNIQTGQNQPVREYNNGVVIVSNPINRSEVGNFSGIPLALVQTDSNGKIVSIDSSVKRNYTLGGAIDVVSNQIIDSAVPDLFLTDRMFANNQISAPKFADGVITSPKLAIWDGSSSNFSTSGTSLVPGSGVGTDHLKGDAVTESKINYSGSTSGFAVRNRLPNSSFELSSANLEDWTIQSGTNYSQSVSINLNQLYTNHGFQSAKLTGGFDTTAKTVGIEQTVDFNDNIKGKPITAFASVRPLNGFNLAVSGTTGIYGQLDFVSQGNAVVKTVVFGAYSGAATDWQKLQTSEPVISDVDARLVKISIFGAFDNTVYVDSVFLGETSFIPSYDVTPQEQITSDLNASAITSGQLPGERIAPGAILTTHVRNADSSVNTTSGGGIATEQLKDAAVTGLKIADGTITSQKLASGVLAVPAGVIVMWDDKFSNGANAPNGCPTGWTDITSRLAGRFPLGYNTGAGTNIPAPGKQTIVKATGQLAGNDGLGVRTKKEGYHSHTGGTGGGLQPGYGGDVGPPDRQFDFEEIIPYYTVRFCQKD